MRWPRVSWTRRDAARRTFATMMPIIKTNEVTASWPMPSAAAKNEIPKAKAIAEMIWMKWWISLLMGVCSASVLRANCAILPMTCVARTLSISIPRRGASRVMTMAPARSEFTKNQKRNDPQHDTSPSNEVKAL